MPWLGPDGKSQVTVEYEDGIPKSVKKVVIATQHNDMLDKFGSEAKELERIVYTRALITIVCIGGILICNPIKRERLKKLWSSVRK